MVSMVEDEEQQQVSRLCDVDGVGRGVQIPDTAHQISTGIKSPARDYSIPGTSISKIFTTIGASASLAFIYNSGMLPEIQATIRQPAVKNMKKALNLYFGDGVLPMFVVIFIGYWAYGSSTSAYLLKNVNGPLWAKGIAHIAVFLQSTILIHVLTSELKDTKYGGKGSSMAFKNLSFRVLVRGGYLTLTTFISALMPFLGDFMSLTGAISSFPLTFILANHMYLVANGNKLRVIQKLWHWLNICFFGIMSIAASIAAIRLIKREESDEYSKVAFVSLKRGLRHWHWVKREVVDYDWEDETMLWGLRGDAPQSRRGGGGGGGVASEGHPRSMVSMVEDEEQQQQVSLLCDVDGVGRGVQIPDTAHQISTDSWFQVSFLMIAAIHSAYVLGYSGTIMVPLGWIGGVVGLLLVNAISLYASALIAMLHEYGGQRHIRYRDLAGYIYGRKMYYLTWVLQSFNLFMINAGFIILAGSALKAFYVLYWDDNQMKLPHFIAITGFACAVFAICVPHLSALGIWLAVSTALTLVVYSITLVLSIQDGIKSPARDYSIPGTSISKIFTTIGASASLAFIYNYGMLPEIQATIRQPAVKNMKKALNLYFGVGVLPMFVVIFIGYWAYGSSTSAYLLKNVNGPVWAKGIAHIAVFLQSTILIHISACPMYEYLDTKYGGKGSSMAFKNLSFRVLVRGGYLTLTTFISALMPFLGDFMSLTGAISSFPLTFILANHMYLVANGNKLRVIQKLWHWLNICFFGIMSVAASIAAIRLIVLDSKTYHFFADL
ncbi:hypothetical protein RIF29_17481 [Crotalaria pallida]|uniref:Amino acid transporter transmembrane domain-containing protein n=1 Tax=Crotalaria pallida TaxID=3830 RepID=A0AAN9FH76_CROPI